MPPDHASKKKGGSSHHYSTNNSKEDKHAKVKEKHEEDPSTRFADEVQEDDVNSQAQEESNAVEEQVPEPPKPPYDAMRSEPILTKLIVKSYEGDLDENGFYEGEGMVHFVGGHWYKGTLKHNHMNGQGVYSWADGTMYAGEFSDNTITGKGVYSWSDGSIYEGEVKDGFRNGQGTYRCGTCPSMYNGAWVNGMRHGKGILYFDEKCESYYDGDWKWGKRHGLGIHKYKSGNFYEGQWSDNIRNGKGKMHWFDRGEEYDGNWVNGIQNGEGTHTWFSKRVAISQYPIRNEYTGTFVDGLRHGYGVFYYASGAKYSGEWSKNLKSGKGEFMFKNGSVFKGMFENDHIVDFPDLMPSGMTTPDIVEAGIPVRSQTPMRAPSPGAAVGTVDAVLDINLTEIFIAYQFDIEQQQIEVDEVTRVILRHMTQIKQIYKFYSSLGTLETPDNTFVMSRMQFWRFLKDCGLHTFGFTLVDLDSADGISETKEDIHDPSTKIYVRDFVNGLIHIAYMIFKEDDEAEESFVSSSLLKMITENVLPNACTVKGTLFSSYDKTKEALKYIDECNDAFQYFRCKASANEPKRALRIRNFLWMLKDFKLFNQDLTVSRFLDIVYCEDQLALEDRAFNLENEVVFLEFFEALLQCSQAFRCETKTIQPRPSILSNGQEQVIFSPTTEVKSPTLTKADDVLEDDAFEALKSPLTAPSPDKTTIVATESVAPTEQTKQELIQSPTIKTQETGTNAGTTTKSSTAGGSRREHHASKESSAAGASRGKRRGTVTLDHADPDSKVGSAATSKGKEKAGKEKKNGTKSGKKVVIEDDRDKASTTNITQSNLALRSVADQESEIQSTTQQANSTVVADGTTNQQSTGNDTDSSPGKSQVSSAKSQLSIMVEEETADNIPGSLHQIPSLIPTQSSHGNISVEAVEDRTEEDFQKWSTNLRIFFEEHFFPAFNQYKTVDRNIEKQREAQQRPSVIT